MIHIFKILSTTALIVCTAITGYRVEAVPSHAGPTRPGGGREQLKNLDGRLKNIDSAIKRSSGSTKKKLVEEKKRLQKEREGLFHTIRADEHRSKAEGLRAKQNQLTNTEAQHTAKGNELLKQGDYHGAQAHFNAAHDAREKSRKTGVEMAKHQKVESGHRKKAAPQERRKLSLPSIFHRNKSGTRKK